MIYGKSVKMMDRECEVFTLDKSPKSVFFIKYE